MNEFDCYDEDNGFDNPYPDKPYHHNYGPNYRWLTNTSEASLEAHISRCKEEGSTFYEEDYSNLVSFPDAYNVFGRKVESMIAICRRID